MKPTLIILLAAFVITACSPKQGTQLPTITPPPAELNLDPFYAKYLDVRGVQLISSERVPDQAMHAAYRTMEAMMRMLPDTVAKTMAHYGAKVAVMSKDEVTTDIPEHAYLKADTVTNWDTRARGLGGDIHDPTSSCAEENLLCLPGDRYHAEDILIHEFAHAIHQLGIAPTDPSFDERLRAGLEAAMAAGRWADTYAATNIYEYWAEGVQNWFDVNTEVEAPNGVHNRVNTREEMKRYDPTLYAIVASYFPETQEQISNHTYKNNYNQE